MLRWLALSLFICFGLITDADAANKFWVGGGSSASWGATAPTNWANSSGGAGNQAVPATGDAVFFDANSGTGAATWDATISLASLICTGSRNNISHGSVGLITISSGDYELPSGLGGTYVITALTPPVVTFTGTSGTQHITTHGFTVTPFTFNGVGGTFQLQDNVTMTTVAGLGSIILTNGTLDGQSFDVAMVTFTSNNANVRALKGSGNWTVGIQNNNGIIWDTNTSTNLDISLFSGTVVIAGTTSATRYMNNGAITTYNLNIGPNTLGGLFVPTTNGTYASLTISGPETVQILTLTVSSAAGVQIHGTKGNEVFLVTNVISSQHSLTVASGNVNMSWVGIRDINFIGGATFMATNSFDLGDNAGITILPPGGSGGSCILGGWLLWRDFDFEHINDNFPAWLEKAG